MQSKMKIPTKTITVNGVQVTIRLMPITVTPNQVKVSPNFCYIGENRIFGTDEAPRKPVTGFRIQVQWGKGNPWYGKKAPLFISASAAFAQHSKSDEPAAVLVTQGDNGQNLLISVSGGDAAGSFTWWGVYSRYGLGASFSEGPI